MPRIPDIMYFKFDVRNLVAIPNLYPKETVKELSDTEILFALSESQGKGKEYLLRNMYLKTDRDLEPLPNKRVAFTYTSGNSSVPTSRKILFGYYKEPVYLMHQLAEQHFRENIVLPFKGYLSKQYFIGYYRSVLYEEIYYCI